MRERASQEACKERKKETDNTRAVSLMQFKCNRRLNSSAKDQGFPSQEQRIRMQVPCPWWGAANPPQLPCLPGWTPVFISCVVQSAVRMAGSSCGACAWAGVTGALEALGVQDGVERDSRVTASVRRGVRAREPSLAHVQGRN